MARLALALVVVLAVAGCSDDDDGVLADPATTAAPTTAPTTAAPTATTALGRVLVEDYPCGYGFWSGSADQTLALRVGAEAGRSPVLAEGRPEPLAGGRWDAVLLRGADLYSNWCDDVFESSEPVARVDEELPVTAGTITVLRGARRPGYGANVSAELHDVVATDGDGHTVEVGDVIVLNRNWGGAAG